MLYVNANDSLHWKLVGETGVITGSNVSRMVNITFYSPNPQNVYFICSNLRSADEPLISWSNMPFYFPLDTPLFGIFATGDGEVYSSWEEGYLSGLRDANSDIDSRLYQARKAGERSGYQARSCRSK